MPNPSPILPDAMPLREALRGLRHVLRKGGETLKDTVAGDTLPQPAAQLAGIVFREVETIAKGMDDVASGLAKKLIGGSELSEPPSFDMVKSQRDGGVAFAQCFYSAAQAVLKRLGVTGVFISEAGARLALQHVNPGESSDSAVAAALTIALQDAKVFRGAPNDGARIAASAIEPVALFALVLWLQSQRPETEGEAALNSATDLSAAISADIVKACSSRDQSALAALYTEFSSHV